MNQLAKNYIFNNLLNARYVQDNVKKELAMVEESLKDYSETWSPVLVYQFRFANLRKLFCQYGPNRRRKY